MIETMLPYIWVVLIAVGIFMYVMLDGFDLGIGILFPLLTEGEQRNLAISSIAPFWDGNETWLILGAGGLFVAFPLAYSILLPALYIPLYIMLMGLVFRGVAFEFRTKANTSRPFWDSAFHLGSLIAALCQGMMIGAFLQGFHVVDDVFVGTATDWFSPICLLTGIGTVVGYGLLGTCWLNMKTTGALQQKVLSFAKVMVVIFFVVIAGISLWSIWLHPYIYQRWFTTPNSYFTWIIPLATLIVASMLYRAITQGNEFRPFFLTLGIFTLSYIGLLISLMPYMVPPSVSFIDAAAPAKSQFFVLVGVVILLPVILGYTGYIYWVFRGKTKIEHGYH